MVAIWYGNGPLLTNNQFLNNKNKCKVWWSLVHGLHSYYNLTKFENNVYLEITLQAMGFTDRKCQCMCMLVGGQKKIIHEAKSCQYSIFNS